jgi:ElaB/YqjD/DUF883 family membrane-anchored ribosome-binding protein
MVNAKNNVAGEKIQAAISKLKTESNAKEKELVELVSSIYETVKETQEKAVDKVVDTASTVNEAVHSHPWPYIGGAALGGFLLGMFSRR